MENLKINKSNFITYKKGGITNEYSVGAAIGSGSFGTVKKGIHKKTGQERAIKILKKSEQDENRLFLEVEILSRLNHPNIMQIYEFYDDNKYFYIISEYCRGGELFDTIIEKGNFTEKMAAQIMKQLISSINYSHKNNIVHRDLKPENILLDDESDEPIIKIIDWGGGKALNSKIFLQEQEDDQGQWNTLLHCS